MAVPERRPETTTAPALPGPVQSAQAPVHLDPPRDVGWIIILLGAVGALLGSWGLFGLEADGMWAGYWVSLLGTMGLAGALWLRTRVLPLGGAALCGLSAAAMILLAVLKDWGLTVDLVMIGGGIVMLLGVALQAAGGRRP